MKTFFISILVALGSLFGFHPQSSLPVTAMNMATTTPSTNQVASSTLPSSASTSTVPVLSFDTTGWQTYQSNQYGIGLKYPTGWSLRTSSSVNRSNSNIILDKNGYELTVNMCSEKDCATSAADQEYAPNDWLSPSVNVPLNVGGIQAWRTAEPLPNGEDDPTLYFDFTFLRKATPAWNNPSFDDTSKYTPISRWINENGMVYTINYQPGTATASNYDHSIINLMDEIVQTISFTKK